MSDLPFGIGMFLMLMLMLMVTRTSAFELPEVIGEITYGPQGRVWDFACVGDQNENGRDELFIVFLNDTLFHGYWGNGHLSLRPNIYLPMLPREMRRVASISRIGRYTDEFTNLFQTMSVSGDTSAFTSYYSLSDNQGDVPILTNRTRIGEETISSGFGKTIIPMDFNGDGYDDCFRVHQINDDVGRIEVLYGGDEFDTEPDWVVHYSERVNYPRSFGRDVNGDGYDDILYQHYYQQGRVQEYQFFFGEAEPDTIPAFVFQDTMFHVEGGLVNMRNFSLLQDVNGDGYDDWAIVTEHLWEFPDHSIRSELFTYLFFGGESLDAEPDVRLEGPRGPAGMEGSILSGDFNGDGLGDIALGYWKGAPPVDWGEIQIHLGNRWIDETADIYVPHTAYNNRYPLLGIVIGAVGDYNGDGCDDIVAPPVGSDIKLVVLAGSSSWELEAQNNALPQKNELTLNASPNPFNNNIKLTYNLSFSDAPFLKIFDVQGRLIRDISVGQRPAGDPSEVVPGFNSGIYFAVLHTSHGRVIRKIVCLK